jgi:3-mercaptopyruvate sulfurtransferase SseA
MIHRALLPVACLFAIAAAAAAPEIPNRLIDYATFENAVDKVGKLRKQRRITENQFLLMAQDPATVILDARSREMFERLHVKNARNLSLPDITADELSKIIPSKATRVLIYCNNNFENEPRAFPTKAPAASLNIHTLNVLYAYGYENVYELGPLLDVRKTKIPFEGQVAGS